MEQDDVNPDCDPVESIVLFTGRGGLHMDCDPVKPIDNTPWRDAKLITTSPCWNLFHLLQNILVPTL